MPDSCDNCWYARCWLDLRAAAGGCGPECEGWVLVDAQAKEAEDDKAT